MLLCRLVLLSASLHGMKYQFGHLIFCHIPWVHAHT